MEIGHARSIVRITNIPTTAKEIILYTDFSDLKSLIIVFDFLSS